jgi:hypothetical protein
VFNNSEVYDVVIIDHACLDRMSKRMEGKSGKCTGGERVTSAGRFVIDPRDRFP